MALVMRTAPAAEPISVADAKAYLRVDGSSEDALISSLILTSRLHIETALGLALITQDWRLVLDRWPEPRVLRLPLRPAQSVEEVRVYDAGGIPSIVDPSGYIVEAAETPPRLTATVEWPRPERVASGIEIDFTAGFGASADDVPEPIRQALLLLVVHWYEHRDPIEIGSEGAAIPANVSRLLNPYRLVRI